MIIIHLLAAIAIAFLLAGVYCLGQAAGIRWCMKTEDELLRGHRKRRPY